MRHRIDERVVLLISANLANQERGVENQTGDDGRKNQAAEQQRPDLPKSKDNPPNVQRGRQRYEADTEGDEKRDDALPARGDGHRRRIAYCTGAIRLSPQGLEKWERPM